ncbi:MAG: NTP transferase domain-containing protein [Delftia sp.]|nr:NTP transferase domain-containing protein [Delftia sp.]
MSKIIRRFEDLSTPLVAIISAGGRYDPDDPLLHHSGVQHKALIPIAGKPIIAHVAQALADSGYVARLIVVGLEQEHDLDFALPATCVPAAGSIMENVLVGLEALERVAPGAERVLMCACDVPLVTGKIVRYLVDTMLSTGADVCYTAVRRETMEARFPGSGRSFVPLLDGRFAGGDINLLNPDVIEKNRELLDSILGARKNAWTQARLIGLRFLLKFIFRRLTIADGERKAQSIFGVPCRVIPVRYAELGMDVDKPQQLELVRAEMEGRIK